MKITKAVIPAAGMGTRMLPVTKALPKSMISIVDKPAIQYIVEEAVKSGITDIAIIINPLDFTIRKHFAKSSDLEHYLVAHGKSSDAEKVSHIARLAEISFIVQEHADGLGAAVMLASGFTGGEPFAVLYADDIIVGKPPAMEQVISAFYKYGLGAAGIKAVPEELISKYSSLKLDRIEGQDFRITDMVEKPRKGEAFTMYSVMGRCALPPKIYDILKQTPPGFGGEIQLTDAMKSLAREEGMIGVDFAGKRFDAGNKLDLLKCAVEIGMSHPDIGGEFTTYIKELLKTQNV